MHELGVVFYVVKYVKKVAEENHVEKVSAVTLEIGEMYSEKLKRWVEQFG